MYFIRIEFSGIKLLDDLNKNINTSNFNAALSISIIFLIIFSVTPLLKLVHLSMLHLLGIARKLVLVVELVGFILKLGLIDLCMECIPTLSNGGVNATFIIVLGLMGSRLFCSH